MDDVLKKSICEMDGNVMKFDFEMDDVTRKSGFEMDGVII